MDKCSKALVKDSKKYSKKIKQEKVEKKEAMSAAKDLKNRAKHAHES